MKKNLLNIITLLALLFFVPSVYAVTSTPTPTAVKPTASPTTKETLDKKLSDQINQLKEKIASRVSELNLVERRGIIGIITEVPGNKITLIDVSGKTRFVDVDEITKFSSGSNKSFGLSDLTKGTRISVLGLYNKQSKRILARFINTTVDPVFISGAISNLDEENFYATITTPDGKQIKLDVQTTTKTVSYSKDEELVKSGFSKLELGNRVTVIGFPDKKDPNLIVANRIVVLPTLPKNPKIIISVPSPTEEITTTPTKKVTPTQP